MIEEKEHIVIKSDIKSMIYEIRDKQVMLDSDLAKLYKCANGTKTINQAVKRNIDRFPDDFYFQLTSEEYELVNQERNLRFQTETANEKMSRYNPYVFTEQGVAMLASILRTEIAAEVSINIMRTFVEMRKFINTNKNMFERVITLENNINAKFIEYDNKFEIVFNELQKEENFKQKIFFEGQIYDAYSLIIDNYIDKTILDMLSNKETDVKVIIVSKESKLSELDILKFNKQYPKLEIKISKKFHDRFIIIDNETLYHIGASLKDLGNKCFGINKIIDKLYLETLIKEL